MKSWLFRPKILFNYRTELTINYYQLPMTTNNCQLSTVNCQLTNSLFPNLVFLPKHFGKSNSGVHRSLRLGSQRHCSFRGSSIALTRIAPFASRHHVVPSVQSTLRSRHDVIQRQTSIATAVLARMSIAAQNFPAIHRRHFPKPFPIAKSQANLFGYVDTYTGRSH